MKSGYNRQPGQRHWSRPARALWIEIVDITDKEGQSVIVEAREGLVD